MKQQGIFFTVFNILLYFCLQILIFRNVALFDMAFCFVYVGFILLIPLEFPQLLTLLLAFSFGLGMDIFYDTLGIHAGACVLIAYIRPYIIHFLTPRGGYDANSEVSITYMGFQWFVSYAFIMVLVHHFVLFIIESWGIGTVWYMLSKTVLSAIFSVVIIVLFQYLLYPAKRQ
jgi:hypothetical protein